MIRRNLSQDGFSSYRAAAARLAGREQRRLTSRAWLRRDHRDDSIYVRLVATDIIRYYKNGDVLLTANGWCTIMTADYMTTFGPCPVYRDDNRLVITWHGKQYAFDQIALLPADPRKLPRERQYASGASQPLLDLDTESRLLDEVAAAVKTLTKAAQGSDRVARRVTAALAKFSARTLVQAWRDEQRYVAAQLTEALANERLAMCEALGAIADGAGQAYGQHLLQLAAPVKPRRRRRLRTLNFPAAPGQPAARCPTS